MRVFISILLLVSLALIATSPRLRRLRRSRPVSLLLSGGWLAVATGILVGPSGLRIVDDDAVESATPLILAGLGWVGLMIGLQARRDVLRRLPSFVIRLTAIDALLSALFFASLAWFVLGAWVQGQSPAWRLAPTALIVAAGVGWSMETRSLGPRGGGAAALAMSLRSAGGVSALIALAGFGVAVALPRREIDGVITLDWLNLGIKLLAASGLAVALGLLARFGIRSAGKDRSQLLVVFLGVVALVSGVAADLALSALFSAMLTGAVITNLAGRELRQFERFVIEAEHVFAVLFAMLAGILMDLAIGWWGLALAVGIAATRFLVKPVALRLAEGDHEAMLRGDARLSRLTVIRQSPVAIALAVGLAFSQPTGLDRQLLAVIVLAGLLAEIAPLLALTRGRLRERRAVRTGAPRFDAAEGGAA